jgi:hypothetical protein
VLTPPLYRTVAIARRADIAPIQAAQAFTDTLLSFLGDIAATGGLSPDVQILHRGQPGQHRGEPEPCPADTRE